MYSASVAVMLGVGSRFEDDVDAGSSHLLEHMLFKGTERRPSARIISEEIEGTGGALDASTGKEETIYSARVAGADLDLAIDLLADMTRHSLVEPAEVEKEKQVIVEELGMSLDSPQEWVHTLLDGILWPGHPLGRDIAGTRESVAALSREGLLSFRTAHYLPATTVISVAGAIDEEAVLAAIESRFASWQPGPRRSFATSAPRERAPRVTVDRRATEQVNLCLAADGVHHHDPDRYAYDLLAALLGGGISSRLFLEVRELRALVYDIHSFGQRYADTGAFVTYAGVDPENVREVVAEILRQMNRLREEVVDEAELERFKKSYTGRLLLGLEDTYGVATWCGGQMLLRDTIHSPEEVIAGVQAVTPGDIQRLACRLFTDDALRLAAIGPLGSREIAALERLLHL
ncbi:MAG: pitrilysin family protein [Chloroflexota bacterium]